MRDKAVYGCIYNLYWSLILCCAELRILFCLHISHLGGNMIPLHVILVVFVVSCHTKCIIVHIETASTVQAGCCPWSSSFLPSSGLSSSSWRIVGILHVLCRDDKKGMYALKCVCSSVSFASEPSYVVMATGHNNVAANAQASTLGSFAPMCWWEIC